VSDVAVSLVIPAYNESARLAAGYERLREPLEALGVDSTEVVLVDDGSRDDTMAVAQRVYGRLPHFRGVRQEPNQGKGAALRLGFAVARAPLIVTADADLSISPRHLPEYVAALASCDVAPGSRARGGAIAYRSVVRTAAGRAFNAVVRHYTATTLRDTQCGGKGFRAGAARVLGLLGFFDRFAFDAELLYLADRLGLRVSPVDVTWDDVAGSSVRVGRDSLQMVRDLRALRRTRYENPVVECARDVSLDQVAALAASTRLVGLAVARGSADALVVLPRSGATGGAGLAAGLGGRLRTALVDELAHRELVAV
jgi:glycosyltransferase involved in cell wall biosynthesis